MAFPWTKFAEAGPFFLGSKSKYRIHSPFVFGFINFFEQSKLTNLPNFNFIEAKRLTYLSNHQKVDFTHIGGGSRVLSSSPSKTVKQISSSAVSSKTKSHLIYRLAEFICPTKVIEIGTSLGINSMYLASLPNTNFVGIEPVDFFYNETKKNLIELGLIESCKLYHGKFQEILPHQNFKEGEKVFIYFDGDHTKQAVIQLIDLISKWKSIELFALMDDIRWSKEMLEGWRLFKDSSAVSLSLDMFQLGLVSTVSKHQKEEFKIYNRKIFYSLLN